MRSNKLFQVWISPDQHTRILKELETFGGSTLKEQTDNFWNWYFYAKQEGKLLKPDNKEELPQSPDAPRCKYHTCTLKGKEEVWKCDCIGIDKEDCLNRYRWHNQEKKSCFPARREPKMKQPAFNANWRQGSGAGKVDWGSTDGHVEFFGDR